MKYVWEEKDIKAGRRVKLPHETGEECIIGYDGSQDSKSNKTLTSLSDGSLFLKGQTAAQMVESLNKSGYVPLSL